MRALQAIRALLLAALIGLASLVATSSVAAQDPDDTTQNPDDRASAFRAVSGPQVDRVPGGKLLIGAYGVAWVLLLGYLWRLGRLHAANARELERLQSMKAGDGD